MFRGLDQRLIAGIDVEKLEKNTVTSNELVTVFAW